ncbi:MAG: family 16 glycoside hydrolase [Thermoguttaceae bacterium]
MSSKVTDGGLSRFSRRRRPCLTSEGFSPRKWDCPLCSPAVRLIAAAGVALLLAADAWGQQRKKPGIGYLYPAGARQGTTVQVEVGGLKNFPLTQLSYSGHIKHFSMPTHVHVSGKGIQATITGFEVKDCAESRKEYLALATELRSLLKDPPDAAAQRRIAEIRMKAALLLGEFTRRTIVFEDPVPAPSHCVVFVSLALAPDAELGRRELRLETTDGLSNPLPFCVGDLPEFRRTDFDPIAFAAGPLSDRPPLAPSRNIIHDVATGGRVSPAPDYQLPPRPSFTLPAQLPPPMSSLLLVDCDMKRRAYWPPPLFTLPAVVNGQIFPGEADRFRFQARKGQQLVIASSARELMRYIWDGSPGWFQIVLALYDPKGKEVAYNNSYRFHQDSAILYKVPADGEYTLEIRDSLYRGRGDFVYRVAVSEHPMLTSIFPLGGPAGGQTTVKLEGWNLPADTLTHDARGKGPGTAFISVRNKEGVSNQVPFALDSLPECLEREPNDTPADAQSLTLPAIVNGRIDPPGDRDVFRFEGKAGQEIVAEVHARRLDSPLDSFLQLTDANGKQLAFNDDYEDKGAGLRTHHADSHIRATLPADGTYYLELGDIQGKGGPEYAYRLHVRPPQGDFELRAVPSGMLARPGETVPVTVHVLRKEGFSGPVTVKLKDAPDGFKLSDGYVSPGSPDLIRLSLTAPPAPLERAVKVALEGRATVGGREIVRPVVPADEMEQAFGASKHLVAAREFLVAVRERAVARLVPPIKQPDKSSQMSAAPPPVVGKVLGTTPIRIPIEGTAGIQVSMPAKPAVSWEFVLSDPPEGIAMKTVYADGAEVVLTVQSDPAKGSRPGMKGNLTVNVFEPGVKRHQLTGVLPAIPFEVVGPAASPPGGKAVSAEWPSLPDPAKYAKGELVSLFNGKDLTGWEGSPQHWKVEDGAIVAVRVPVPENHTYLIWKGDQEGPEAADFELHVKVRDIAVNSGIHYRCSKHENYVLGGPSLDIAGPTAAGWCYFSPPPGRNVKIYPVNLRWLVTDCARPMGKIDPALEPKDLMKKIKTDDWNEMVVIALGSRIIHKINDAVFLDMIDQGEGARAKGYIGFQLHSGPGGTIKFKDIRFRRLVVPKKEQALGKQPGGEKGDSP